MRKLPIVSGVLVAGALAVAACSGSAATPIPSVKVPTVPPIPSVAIPSVPSIPSIAVPSIAIPNGSFSLPSFSIPSFTTNADPALAAMFPTTVSGQPVTDVQTGSFAQYLAFLNQYDPTSTAKFTTALSGAGIDANTVTTGSGNVTLGTNEDQVNITAFHTPGANAANLVTAFEQLSVVLHPEESPPTITQGNVGGKNIIKVSNSDGTTSYVYANNDVLWSVDGTGDETEAAAVLQALP